MVRKNNFFLLFLKKTYVILVFCLFLVNVQANELTISGVWRTVDDVSKRSRSLITIEKKDEKYHGVIKKIFYEAGEGVSDRCKVCPGERHNKRILGMKVLWDLQKNGASWYGKIIDPKNGKIYRCKLTLDPHGRALKVRGYIGFPLLGRTQIWYRQVKR